MSKNPLIRVAGVKFNNNGKSYPTRCDREDINEGDEVEVLMRAGTSKEHIMQGEVTEISLHRWECSCHVINLASEVEYSIDSDGSLNRIVTSSNSMEKHEMRELYKAVSIEDGEDAYLGDGVWISSDGSLDDRGR